MLILFFFQKSQIDFLKGTTEMGLYRIECIFIIWYENMNRTNDEITSAFDVSVFILKNNNHLLLKNSLPTLGPFYKKLSCPYSNTHAFL